MELSATSQGDMTEYGIRRVIVTITAMLCALLETLDVTIVNVAVAHMQGNLGATLSEAGWVVTAYAMGNAIIIPMTGWLARQFGRVNYFTASILLFTFCSFLCGNAHGIWELVVFRFMQGLCGGALLSTSQAIITEAFPREKCGMAQAIFGLGVIIGPSVGPMLGGYIVDHYSWRLIFYINIPIGIVASLLAVRFIRNPLVGHKKALYEIDWWGILLLAISVGSLQYVLERGQEDDWFNDRLIVIMSVIFVLGFLLFLWRELVYEHPIVSLKTLKNGNLCTGIILTFIVYINIYGVSFVMPLYTQLSLGWTASQSGTLLALPALTSFITLPLLGWLLQKKINLRYLVGLGMIILAISCFGCYRLLTPYSGKGDILPILFLRTLGAGMLIVPVNLLSLSTLKPAEIADGAAFSNMTRQLGGSFGIAMITTFLARRQMVHRTDLVSHMTIYDQGTVQHIQSIAQAFMVKGMTTEHALQASYKVLDLGVTRQAMILSYMDIFWYMTVIFAICVPIVLAIRKAK